MTLTDLLLLQLSDPFRIGLLIALFYTMLRTQATSGTFAPLAAGAVFVAVLIPSAVQTTLVVPFWQAVVVGIGADVILLAVILGAWTAYLRFRR
jgi:peptidoglycan/LPS O-acetylase OafA/YrhL